ncbi:SGNH/GDSL hydrolase family protein [Nocardioides flavescens]|uniref:SGNH/GDSL hydrolase family protein n=1 Tax=Nocardioides flavescens TaxID=2691959 RepID=A0A6L7F2H7_9ACTN|nr:SGNH/GDSL hydrolase family protein [Nocardioides flavescens]MXG91102.1 SGNH/GDSL hydrolase family protein [Nocardioides flavescens]
MTSTRRVLVALATLLVLPALVLGLLPGAAGAGTPGERLKYVALGDSYSAASGVLPVDLTSPACLRSTRNYPNVVARTIGARLTDVTCGAAETRHFSEPQYPGVAPQLDALDARTDLVTMTIGGNDSSVFIGAIAACGAAGLTTLGTGSPCRDTYGTSFEDTVRTTTYPALVSALQAVQAKAPHARVAILGYPWITPASGSCYPQLPVARGDVAYLHSLQTTLNDAVRRAAAATGATYVDLDQASTGHDACQAIGTRWVEPVVGTTNPVVVHPNALGEREMAAEAIRQLGL